jgi:ketosteroid isomerase-like protein/thiol-disulfide isomerase/thioredoxin
MRLPQRILGLAGAGLLLGSFANGLAQAPVSFAPFEDWKKAVASGDQAALAQLYSSHPPAVAQVGSTKLAKLDDECKFWVGLKSSGVTELHPKVLDISSFGGMKKLILRVECQRANGKAAGGRENLVLTMAQLWAPQEDAWRIMVTQRGEFAVDAGRRLPQPSAPNPRLYSDPSEAHAELTEALGRAARDHKRVLVMFGANWCYDCHVLDTTLHSKEFAPLLEANYVPVHINIGEEGKDNNDLAAVLGVGLNRGIPSLGVLEPDGKVVFAQKDGEFESTVKIGPEDVCAFLEKWKPASPR